MAVSPELRPNFWKLWKRFAPSLDREPPCMLNVFPWGVTVVPVPSGADVMGWASAGLAEASEPKKETISSNELNEPAAKFIRPIIRFALFIMSLTLHKISTFCNLAPIFLKVLRFGVCRPPHDLGGRPTSRAPHPTYCWQSAICAPDFSVTRRVRSLRGNAPYPGLQKLAYYWLGPTGKQRLVLIRQH